MGFNSGFKGLTIPTFCAHSTILRSHDAHNSQWPVP